MFNPSRLRIARQRRQKTRASLAEAAGLAPLTITRWENGENAPEQESLELIADVLNYPLEFFCADDPEVVDTSTVSFRSLSKMSARERDAAIAASSLGLELAGWTEGQFELPAVDLIDLSHEDAPQIAARILRDHWGLGENPIGSMIGLLESKGVRVFSLAEDTVAVDAFSFWKADKPYIFLNTQKTAERGRFDAAHELAHLVLHKHSGPSGSRNSEREADQFAAAFLMPSNDLRSRITGRLTADSIIKWKKRWRVSAMALSYQLHKLGRLSDWQYKSLCIELGRRGYRMGEPDGIDREISILWSKILTALWKEKVTKETIASDLNFPLDEVEALVWSLTGSVEPAPDQANRTPLRLVQ